MQMQDGLLVEGKLQEYLRAFEAVDTSGNGLIGANEIMALFEQLGQPLKSEKLAKIMDDFDADQCEPALTMPGWMSADASIMCLPAVTETGIESRHHDTSLGIATLAVIKLWLIHACLCAVQERSD